MKLSICIPTYNRSRHLENCLHSVLTCLNHGSSDFEVCISDNGSTDDTEEVVTRIGNLLPIKYWRNETNLGIPRNFLNVVDMAEGEFVWLVGDDDLFMPDAIMRLVALISEHPAVDFFYVNAYHLSSEYVLSQPRPFDTLRFPSLMKMFSSRCADGELPFLDLISPSVSFDFLGGMFLSVFRRKNWIDNMQVLNTDALNDERTFSHFDNTFPHVKIFSRAYARSRAYFNTAPLIVCLSGAREWAPMYPLVRSFRLLEALDEYRQAGLPLFRYLYCRNFALSHFLPDLLRMALRPSLSGWYYVSPFRFLLSNLLFPNLYLSPIIDKVRRITSARSMPMDVSTRDGDTQMMIR